MRQSKDVLELMRAKKSTRPKDPVIEKYDIYDSEIVTVEDANGFRIQAGLLDGAGKTLILAWMDFLNKLLDDNTEFPPF